MNWPFADQQHVAVITVQEILERTSPILMVAHSSDGWQFLTKKTPSTEEARVVSLETIFLLDPSIAPIADLPIGWIAERTDVQGDWKRYQNQNL